CRQPDGSDRPRKDRAAGRAWGDRLRESESPHLRRGVAGDPALALPRQRRPLLPDEDRVRLLARRRLAVRLHGCEPRDPRAARPRADLPRLRLPERHARPPERVECARPRRPLTPGVRGRRAVRNQDPQGRAENLVAAPEGVLLADAREVRDPRLPPTGLLLCPRLA